MTVDQIAGLFRVSPGTVREWIVDGLPVKVRGHRGAGHKHDIDLEAAIRWWFARNRERLALMREQTNLASEQAQRLAIINRKRLAAVGERQIWGSRGRRTVRQHPNDLPGATATTGATHRWQREPTQGSDGSRDPRSATPPRASLMPAIVAPSHDPHRARLRNLLAQLEMSRADVAQLLRELAAEFDPDPATVDVHVREAAEREAMVLRGEGFTISTSMEVRARAAARVLDRSEKTLRNWRACGVGPEWRSDHGVVLYSLLDLMTWCGRMSRNVPIHDDVGM